MLDCNCGCNNQRPVKIDCLYEMRGTLTQTQDNWSKSAGLFQYVKKAGKQRGFSLEPLQNEVTTKPTKSCLHVVSGGQGSRPDRQGQGCRCVFHSPVAAGGIVCRPKKEEVRCDWRCRHNCKKKKPAVQDKHIKDLAKKKKDLEQQLLITKQQTKLAKITGGQVKAGKKIAAPVPGSDDAPPPEEQKHKLSDKIHHVTVGRLVIYCIIFHSLLSCC